MNLFEIGDLSNKEIVEILELAKEFKAGKQVDFKNQKIVANLFFEPSTRTHYSFVVAAYKLGCRVLDFDPISSSLGKNETFYDTVKFFEAIEADAIVIRSKENKYFEKLNNVKVPILNGGDGTNAHPTQSLLDLLTIYESFNTISNLNILIVGDIKHSRVAHSNIEMLERLNNKVYLSGPKQFQEEGLFFVDIDEYIDKVDVVMLLRVQFERHSEEFDITSREYLEEYGLNFKRYTKLKDEAIIMHPGPVNRMVEVDDFVVECSKSRILEQVNNGLYIRMAVLYNALK